MKPLRHIISIVALLIITFSLYTCKKEEPYKVYGPYTLGEGKDYLNFKPGSWWVYHHNWNGPYDTLVLKNIFLSTRVFEGKNKVIKDVLSFLIYSTTTKYEYKYYTFGANPNAKPEILERANSIDIIHGKSKAGDYNGETVSFFYPFDSNSNSGLGVGETTYIGMDSTLIINGIKFNNVRKFQQTQDPCWDGFTVIYYWAKDVGLIKKEKPKTGESWELINYHVEKP